MYESLKPLAFVKLHAQFNAFLSQFLPAIPINKFLFDIEKC